LSLASLPRGRFGRIGSPFVFLPETGSTNDAAASLGTEGAVVVAGAQTAGRGRRGHNWHSPAGAGLYVSVVLTPQRAAIDPTRATRLLTLAAGVAIAEGVAAAAALHADLKWPNDLFVGRRKLGGILAEADADRVVLGYGVNVLAAAYPPDVADRATSLEAETGRVVDRRALLIATLESLSCRYDDLLAGRFDAILDAWRDRAPAAAGARVSWTTPAGERSGVTSGIDGDGALLVRADQRLERITAGELRWL